MLGERPYESVLVKAATINLKAVKLELKTNTDEDDYTDLAHFIDILNNTPAADLPCALEEVFNVADYLKVQALDVAVHVTMVGQLANAEVQLLVALLVREGVEAGDDVGVGRKADPVVQLLIWRNNLE